MKDTSRISYRDGVPSNLIKNIKKEGYNLLIKQKADKAKSVSKLKAKLALSTGRFSKIGYDSYEEIGGIDIGRIWYLSTDADTGEVWLVKDAKKGAEKEQFNIITASIELDNKLESFDKSALNIEFKDVKAVSDYAQSYGFENLPEHWKKIAKYFVVNKYIEASGKINDSYSKLIEGSVLDNQRITLNKNDMRVISSVVKRSGVSSFPTHWEDLCNYLIHKGHMDENGEVKKAAYPENADGKWENIVFIQGEEAQPLLDKISEVGEKGALKYIVDMYGMGEGGEIYDSAPWGGNDTLYQDGSYTLSYNPKLGYVSLVNRIGETPANFEGEDKNASVKGKNASLINFINKKLANEKEAGIFDTYGKPTESIPSYEDELKKMLSESPEDEDEDEDDLLRELPYDTVAFKAADLLKIGAAFPDTNIPTVGNPSDDNIPPMEWTTDSKDEEERSEEEERDAQIGEGISQLKDDATEEVVNEFGLDLDKRFVDEDTGDEVAEDLMGKIKQKIKPSDDKDSSSEVF